MEDEVLAPPPPPPPPPLSLPGMPDEFTIQALKSLGYSTDQVSPWLLVSEFLQSSTETHLQHQREREHWLAKLEEQNKLVEQAQQDNLNLLAEIAGKLASQQQQQQPEENEEIRELRSALKASEMECARLASIASFAAASKSKAEAEKEDDAVVARLREENAKLHQALQSLQSSGSSSSGGAKPSLADAETAALAGDLLLEEKKQRLGLESKLAQAERELEQTRAALAEAQAALQDASNAKALVQAQLSVLTKHLAKETEQARASAALAGKLRNDLDSLEQVLESERKLHLLRLTELRHASLDVENMSKENRDLASTNDALAEQYRHTRAELDELAAKHARLAGALDASKVERDQVLALYQRTCNELTQEKANMQQIAQELAKSQQREKLLREAELVSNKELAELRQTVRAQRVDLDNMDRMRETLTREVRFVKMQMEELVDSKTMAERLQGNETGKLFTALRESDAMRRELDSTRLELASAHSRLKRLEEENRALSESMLSERLRNSELNETITRARTSQARSLLNSSALTSAAAGAGGLNVSSTSTLSSLSSLRTGFDDMERVLGMDSSSTDELLSEAGSIIRQTQLDRRARRQQ